MKKINKNRKLNHKHKIQTELLKERKPRLHIFRILMCLIIIVCIVILCIKVPKFITQLKVNKQEEIKTIVMEILEEQKEQERIEQEELQKQEEQKKQEEELQKQQEEAKKEQEEVERQVEVAKQQVSSRGSTPTRINTDNKNTSSGYRVTSYYPGDSCSSSSKTGSGKTVSNFSTMTVAGKKVYSYQGKIVVATATEELLKSGYSVKGSNIRQSDKHYFRYGDSLQLNINGTWYDAIVLDSCGVSMWKGQHRIDIFVPNSSNVINAYNVTIKY